MIQRHPPHPNMMYVHFLAATFQIFGAHRSVHTFKSCAEDQIFQDLILHTRLCSTGLFTRPDRLIHFRQVNMIGWKCVVPLKYQLRKGISEGPPNIFTQWDSGKRVSPHTLEIPTISF